MAYQATIIPVMIASPGDVSEEREIIQASIHDWNDINAVGSKVMLAPVGWDTHSSPELGARPQELVNSRVLKDCDLLVGVFWTRLGTPTGVAASGTVEEIEKHVSSGKPAMIYFSSRPVAPQSIDASQFAQVQDFKEQCRRRGLVEEFEDETQFRTKFARHLGITLAKNPYLQELISRKSSVPPTAPSPTGAPPSEADLQMSEEAKELLRAAASDNNGMIMKPNFLGGRHLQAGGKRFGTDQRDFAKWDAALEELARLRLVAARGYKGEVFELTHRGWSIAETLR